MCVSDQAAADELLSSGSLADLLRQIGHDERVHKLDSLANMRAPRFHDIQPGA